MTAPKQAIEVRKGYQSTRKYAWPPGSTPGVNDEFTVSSVTSVTDKWPKDWLPSWAVKMTAERAVDKYEWLGKKIENEGPVEALKWLKKARYDTASEKGDRGTVVHTAVEAYLRGKPLTKAQLEDELRERRVPEKMWRSTAGMLAGVMEFLFDQEPEIIWSEATVYSRTHGYAGTADIIGKLRVGGSIQPAIIDVKTSPRIYDETALQLCAYAYADFVGMDDGTEAELVPGHEGPITHGVVINPKGNGTYERGNFTLTSELFAAFLALVQVADAEDAELLRRCRRP